MTDRGKRWTVFVEQDSNGEWILPFPPGLLAETGWKEGDVLEWIDRGDGSWELKKQQNNEQLVSEAT